MRAYSLLLAGVVACGITAEAEAQRYFMREKLHIATSDAAPSQPEQSSYDGQWVAQNDNPEYGDCSGGTQTVSYQPMCMRNGAVDQSSQSCDPQTKSASATSSRRSCAFSCGPLTQSVTRYYDRYRELAAYPLDTPLEKSLNWAKAACESANLQTQYASTACQLEVNAVSRRQYVYVITLTYKNSANGGSSHYSSMCSRF